MTRNSGKGRLALSVALEGAGWHPAAWRVPGAAPSSIFDPERWVELVRTAERGSIDFVTFEDAFTLQSSSPVGLDDRVDQVRGRLDAALLASRVAPATSRIGLVPTITTTHTEPFHVGVRVASLDHVSGGRAGWRVQIARRRDEAELFGRRQLPAPPAGGGRAAAVAVAAPLFDEAADAVEVARRLWDSWEDDAEVRDRATGRFIDRDRLHCIDFDGGHFSVRGPSITPRSPQGQPVVVVLAHVEPAYDLAALGADVVLVTPPTTGGAGAVLAEVRAAERRVGRSGAPLRVLADLLVLIEEDTDAAVRAWRHLDDLDGAPVRSDAAIVAASPHAIADTIESWQRDGIDGVRLRPARLPVDLDRIVDGLVPELQRRGLASSEVAGDTLRERLGLGLVPNRYAMAGQR